MKPTKDSERRSEKDRRADGDRRKGQVSIDGTERRKGDRRKGERRDDT
jgi:hypothetical protein